MTYIDFITRVDEILYYVWDPIGVNTNPRTRCEYSSYVQNVVRLLETGADVHSMQSYLDNLARIHMGLHYADSSEVAALLVNLYSHDCII